MGTAEDVLRIARGELGYSRWNDPQTGTKYGRWYANLVGSSYYGASGVPFCAMGASWTFDQAGVTCAGFPGAYTPTMLSAAKNAGAVLGNKKDCKPGDVLYFNWDGGVVDHVGFCEINSGSYVQTIEFNTNNGEVCRRTRNWSTVEAAVRPNYGVSTNVKPSTGDKSIDAVAQMVNMTDLSEKEAAAETLLASKGFGEAVVSLTDNSADVVVNAEGLNDALRAQITDIVTRKTGVAAENIIINPVVAEEK